MNGLDRITHDPQVMGGKPCIRGMRVTAGMVLGMLAAGHSREEILDLYPYLEAEDIRAVLEYAAFQAQEENASLPTGETVDRYESLAAVVRETPEGGL
jgi:uncharacterized protein (DUF433 family)